MCISVRTVVIDSPHVARPIDRAGLDLGFYAGDVVVGVLSIVAVVVVAAVLMARIGRETGPGAGLDVSAVSAEGLHIAGPKMAESTVAWSSVFEISVLTRRELRRTWFGFEIRTESHGLLLLDGSGGPGEAFLAECHRFAGFDHERLAEALTRRGSREICYSQ